MRCISLILVAIWLCACSEYQKVLKNDDIKAKYDMAEDLYNAKKYKKANRIYEQIVPQYIGKPQGERILFFYADSYFNTKDYQLSGYQFERFNKSYPKSEKAEQAAFLGAKSYYMLSPRYSIDQTETNEAIDKLQNFINLYPNSLHTEEANNLLAELQNKLEKKDFEIAKQYNTIRDYKAAISAFDTFIADHPGTPFREQAMYYKLDSAYQLAINSYEHLKKERLQTVQSLYNNFAFSYAKSEYLEQAKNMNDLAAKQLKVFQ